MMLWRTVTGSVKKKDLPHATAGKANSSSVTFQRTGIGCQQRLNGNMPLVADRRARDMSTLAATMLATWHGTLIIQVISPILWGRSSRMSWSCTTCAVMGTSGAGTGTLRITTPHHQPAILRAPHQAQIGCGVVVIGAQIRTISALLIVVLTIHIISAVTDFVL